MWTQILGLQKIVCRESILTVPDLGGDEICHQYGSVHADDEIINWPLLTPVMLYAFDIQGAYMVYEELRISTLCCN